MFQSRELRWFPLLHSTLCGAGSEDADRTASAENARVGRKDGIQPASPEAVPADDIRRPIRKRNIAGTEKPGKMRAAGRISLYFFDTDENETKALNVLNLLGERMGKDEKQNKNCGEKRFGGPERGELEAVSTVIDIMIPWRRFLKNPELPESCAFLRPTGGMRRKRTALR